MGYLPESESKQRVEKLRALLQDRKLDAAIVYYDEFNIGNGWYLTGWCPQFESGAVLVPSEGPPLILGGPESEPFAKLDSAVKETRNFTVFMVPDEEYPNAVIIDFPKLLAEMKKTCKSFKRIGLVGAGRMPVDCYSQIQAGMKGIELTDITGDYLRLRYIKSNWEREQIGLAFKLADGAYEAMRKKVMPGVSEIEVAAAGEYASRSAGASGFGFSAIVGSGPRSNAVVPTAGSRRMNAGELVMIGIAPKWQGYAGVVGDVLPVSGKFTPRQKECINYLKEAFRLTKAQLKAGNIGREIDRPAREFFKKIGFTKYLVCPFVHTIGLHEAEAPFFGPRSDDVLQAGMTVCVDVSFFGHPEFNGVRIETGYEVTEKGIIPLSPAMDRRLTIDEQ
jgi:Xaa-Pro aminopeptidase